MSVNDKDSKREFGFPPVRYECSDCGACDMSAEEADAHTCTAPGTASTPKPSDVLAACTPGEWEVGEYIATEKFRKVEAHTAIFQAGSMALLATTGMVGDKLAEADAHLMAASKDLYEAHRDIIALATMGKGVGGFPLATTPEDRLRYIAEIATQALAKAAPPSISAGVGAATGETCATTECKEDSHD